MKTKRIYKRAMAEFLIDNGCTLIEKVPDLINEKHFNWIFVDNQYLRLTMKKFPKRNEV